MSEPTLPRRSATFHGRLNLEQQRKRAKDLLKAARRGEPAALARIAQHLSLCHESLQLADTQLVVAREAGFGSWPRLKAHIDAVDFARRRASVEGDRDRPTLHIRCGSDIRHSLAVAGFSGDFLEFADPFCIGPVPNLPPADFLRVRANFLANAFAMSATDALARLRREYGQLARLETYDRVTLWFEHDSYDQLILAYVLMRLGELQPRASIELIAVDSVPGVDRFIGIGQLAPDVLAWLWRRRVKVTPAQLRLGAEAWSAIIAPTPERLYKLYRTGTPDLPMLGKALERHLRELPAPGSGLGLSERLTLEIVSEHGPLPVGRLFSILMREREPLPYLGDLMFWWLIQALLNEADPLLEVVADADKNWPHRKIGLTATGAAVLSGRQCWLDLMPSPRWVGGVRVPDTGGSWCCDPATGTPVWRASPR